MTKNSNSDSSRSAASVTARPASHSTSRNTVLARCAPRPALLATLAVCGLLLGRSGSAQVASKQAASRQAASEQAASKQARELTVEIFDVRDLLRHSTPPDEGTSSGRTSRLDNERDPSPRSEHLARFLRKITEPKLSPEEDIRGLRGGQIVIRAEQSRIDWVSNLLTAVRSSNRETLLETQIQLIDLDAEQHQALIAQRAPAGLDPRVSRFSYTLQPGTEAIAWAKKLDATANVSQLIAPKILSRPLAASSISTGNTITYRKDVHEVDIGPDGTPTWEIETDTLFHGLKIDLTSTPLGAGIAAAVHFKNTEVDLPVPEFTSRPKPNLPEITVDLPAMTCVEFDQALILPPAGISITSVPFGADRFLLFCVQIDRRD